MVEFNEPFGHGWQDLINSVKDLSAKNGFRIKHIGEKYGKLWIATSPISELVYEEIRGIEDKSMHVCERCGSDKEYLTDGPTLYRTLCLDCKGIT